MTIGDDVLIASHVAISSITHDPDAVGFNSRRIGKEVHIGRNVWIGSHAFIGSGVKVGDGSIVALQPFFFGSLKLTVFIWLGFSLWMGTFVSAGESGKDGLASAAAGMED